MKRVDLLAGRETVVVSGAFVASVGCTVVGPSVASVGFVGSGPSVVSGPDESP